MVPDSPHRLTAAASYHIVGPNPPERPVILSVPHAGRFYPAALEERRRIPPAALEQLEDRYVDTLVDKAQQAGFTIIVAHYARAFIDLNRSESDIDPGMVAGRIVGRFPCLSAKGKGGLGLFPRRLAPYGDLWDGAFAWSDLLSRIDTVHRPYHTALAGLLETARIDHGYGMMIDLHSMPSLTGSLPAQIIIGDRYRQTLPGWLAGHLIKKSEAGGWRIAHNAPYAGGHIIERHACPPQSRFALQVEIDRQLYLDRTGIPLEPGRRTMASFVAHLARTVQEQLDRHRDKQPYGLAAE